jgi:ABC-type nickel/cobalt efflux system permease component RcnA
MSAVLLLLILYAIFKATVFNAFETGRIGIERASYALIMLTGVLLVVLGIRDVIKSRKGCECAARIETAEGAAAGRIKAHGDVRRIFPLEQVLQGVDKAEHGRRVNPGRGDTGTTHHGIISPKDERIRVK